MNPSAEGLLLPRRAAGRSGGTAKTVLIAWGLLPVLLFAGTSFRGSRIDYDLRNDVVVLTGNAVVENGSNRMKADRIILRQKEDRALAEGKVVLLNTGRKVRYEGDRFDFDMRSEVGLGTGTPRLYRDVDGLTVDSVVMRAFLKEDRAEALTNVVIRKAGSNGFESRSARGDFYQEASRVVLKTDVEIRSDRSMSWSDRAVVLHASNQADLEGKVRILFAGSDPGPSNRLEARKVRYLYPSEDRQFWAWDEVLLFDPKDGSTIRGQVLRHKPDRGYTWVRGNTSLRQPADDFSIFADLFERFEGDDRLYAKGAVRIESAGQVAWASLAVRDRRDGTTLLTGNPRVSDGAGGVMSAERIRVDAEGRMHMEGQVRGSWSR